MADLATMTGLDADVVHPADLSDADVGAWRRMQAATPAFGSPLLGPDFARAVGAVRADARVAVYRRGGETVGFLPYHRRAGGFARPIGSPFCDYHALVGDLGATTSQEEALSAAGLGSLRLTGLVDPLSLFNTGVKSRAWGHRIVLFNGIENYWNDLQQASANRRKNYRRYSRVLERNFGPLRIVAPDDDKAALEKLVDWKRQHLERTGLHDFLAVDWTQALMRRLFETRDGSFEGLMISLYAGQRLVAAHFGVRLGDWFHPWISAYDPDLGPGSAGFVHQIGAIAAMPDLGLRVYDLGPDEGHWKTMFANDGAWIGAGLATGSSLSGRVAGSVNSLLDAPLLSRTAIIRRARGRLDQIAALELTVAGRLRGAAHAVATFHAAPRQQPIALARSQNHIQRRDACVPS